MYIKNVEYEDYNGVKRTEDFCFNLNKAELTEMELTVAGGLTTIIRRVAATNNVPEIIKIFKALVLKAYGVKDDDGAHFRKSDKIRDDLESSAAYPIIFMELATQSDKAAEFIIGAIPADMRAEVSKEISESIPQTIEPTLTK